MPTKKRKQQSEPPPPPPPDEASINSSGGGVAGLYGWWARLFGGGSASAASSAPPSTTACLAPGTLPPTFVAGFHDEEAVRSMPYRTLGRTGWAVSALSLGASSLGGVFHCVDQDEAIEVVIQGVRSGINLIDTAPWYGQGESERMLGRALKQVPREAFYLTTKVGRYEQQEERMFDFTARRVTQSVYESMARLGVTYIDCVQVHDPEFAPDLSIIIHETLPALQSLKEQGVVRRVGVTGYPLRVLRRLLTESPVPVDTCLSYCHHTINDATLVPELLPLLEARGVGLINASPLSMGLLTPRGPPAWHPAYAHQKEACREAVAYCEAQGVDITKLALWFSLFSDERVPTTLVSTASLSNLSANLVVARAGPQQLTDKERKVLGHVRSRIFSNKLKGKEGWEGVEVAAYWTVIGKRVVLRDVYGGGGEAITGEAAPAKASSAAAAMDGRSKRQRVARG